jgi:hypothetical protein
MNPNTSDSGDGLQALAEEAVTYAFPLAEMARMRATTSPKRCHAGLAAEAPNDTRRWCNVLVHARELLGAGRSRVVTPNNDTLYVNTWLDLREGPVVIEVPDTLGRYYVLGMLDFYTNPFGNIGQRCTGTGAGRYVMTPPGWSGELPPGLPVIQAPTPWVWIIGRILVDGPNDLAAVHQLQDGFRLIPVLSTQSFPTRFNPGPQMAPDHPDAARFLAVVNQALAENPPPPDERAMVARFAAVGMAAGLHEPSPEQLAVIDHALRTCLARWQGTGVAQTRASGWQYMPRLGNNYGRDYLLRAQVALKYIGALDSLEAYYPMAYHDGQGQPLDGRHVYRLRFAPGALPPAQAFWSLTMYDTRDCMLVPNPIHRFAVGDRTAGLRWDADGGLTLYLQRDAPTTAAALANWLPAPEGSFYVCLRAYLPSANMLEGRYELPAIERL